MGDDSSFIDGFSEAAFYTHDVEVPTNAAKKDCSSSFEILPLDSIIMDLFQKVEQAQTFLALPSTVLARILLNHYKWDLQTLISEYYDNQDNQDAFFEQVKVANPFKIQLESAPDEPDSCKICFLDMEPEDLYGLSCGHKFCKTCWDRHLTTQIADEGVNITVCPETLCKTYVGDEDIIQLVKDHDVIVKYHRLMSNSFVLNDKALRWCPSPGCNFAIKKHRPANSACECKCGFEFCFDCSAEYWHEPVTCERLKQWKSCLQGDSETYEWIAKNAKICPKCDAIIEKNGGCNHMTCRNCGHEFCWICMGDWQRHHACNRFDETTFVGPREMARFKHFADRYVNQMQSLGLEGNLYRDVESLVNNMKDDFGMTSNEVRFFRDAIKVLHVSRRTLTYTFVFAYFLQKNNQVEIFEDNQSDLESAVERLSGFLEQQMTSENVVELKRNIQDSYKYCGKRCEVLMEHIREAEENKLWQMS